jgi:DNA-binding response OmpR family regulator
MEGYLVSQATVFIIEDDHNLALLFSMILKKDGIPLEVIQDGRLALERLSDHVPQLVILDLHLPHVTGAEILRFIRSDPRLAQTKVILATADTTTAATIQDDADFVLYKPISVIVLRDTVHQILSGNDGNLQKVR